MEDEVPDYFQKQKTMTNLCGVHAINNLLGYEVCSSKELDQICYSLSKDMFNPHKHIFGGDYDANILMIALQNAGYECKWLDNRNIETVVMNCNIEDQRRIGYIINKKHKTNGFKKFFGLSDRHWLALKHAKNNKYYELDSLSENKKAEPVLDLSIYLTTALQQEAHILQVLKTIS